MPFIGRSPSEGSLNVMLDAIPASSTATYNLTKDSVAYTPVSAQSLLVSLNGVTQAPIAAYTISGSTIVFASALTSNDVIDYIIAFEGPIKNVGVSDISAGTLTTSMLADDAITVAKMAVNSVDSDQYVDGSIDLIHMSANSVDSDQYVDGSIDLVHMSSESVDEDNLLISNGGTDGNFLQKQSGNTGGLTWAAAGGAYSDWSIISGATNLVVKGQYVSNNGSAVTHTLPAGSAEDTIVIANAGAGTVTLARTSSQKINSADEDATLPQGNSAQLVYVDATIGWFEV